MRPGVAVLTLLLLLSACSQRARDAAPPSSAPEQARQQQPSTPSAAPPPAPKPSGPPARLFTKRFVVKIRQAPNKESFRLGYLRGGAVLQAKSAEPVGYDKCRKGWFELETGGFVCSTVDLLVFSGKRLPERQSLQPDLSTPLPYPYGYSRARNTPMYRRLPTDPEAAQYEGYRIPGVLPPPSPPAPEPDPAETAQLTAALPAAPADVLSGDPGEGEGTVVDAGVPTLASLQGEQGSVLMRRMERGFYVSLDRQMDKGARKYWRTQSNGFIPDRGLSLVEPRMFHGVVLGEQNATLPIAFVMSNKASAYTLNERGGLRRAPAPAYHDMFAVASEADVRGAHYLVAADGRHYRDKEVTRLAAREKPAEVGDTEKWIDVDLGAQSLIAYVGTQPVFATLISSGRVKDELDPLKNFETPTGAFRISSKHLTATMDGDHAIDGPYSIEDVPYVMYFQLAYALHSAFWHNSFGHPHSHGCINLAPLDAKWLFEFVDPPLPKPWHGVFPTTDHPATRLYIHGETPVR
jgi:lipoprotein-anchoring transpeptidase ErfK/SrfK